jgi:hypothetical protein
LIWQESHVDISGYLLESFLSLLSSARLSLKFTFRCFSWLRFVGNKLWILSWSGLRDGASPLRNLWVKDFRNRSKPSTTLKTLMSILSLLREFYGTCFWQSWSVTSCFQLSVV